MSMRVAKLRGHHASAAVGHANTSKLLAIISTQIVAVELFAGDWVMMLTIVPFERCGQVTSNTKDDENPHDEAPRRSHRYPTGAEHRAHVG